MKNIWFLRHFISYNCAQFLSALFIILVGLTVTLYCKKGQNSTNLWTPICRNNRVITPKWINSYETNFKIFYFSDNFWEIWYRMEIFPNQAMDIFLWNGLHSPTAFQHYANSKGRLSFIWLQQKNRAWQTQRTWGGWETVSRRDEVYH